MTELERCSAGLLYDTTQPDREAHHLACADLCFQYNHTRPSDMEARQSIIGKLFGTVGENPYVEPNLFCGFGFNVHVGNNFFANNNCNFVDPATITFGNNVLLAPNCSFYTAGHPLDVENRRAGLEFALPIAVGDDVWIGGNTVVLPGVTIGNNVVIGAGSVVTKNIPSGVIAMGNPCRVIRPITDADARRYGSYP